MKGESVMENQAVIGVVGLAFMGENLALNLANHNFRTAVYNHTVSKEINDATAKIKAVAGMLLAEDYS